jgi:hypothetical protein
MILPKLPDLEIALNEESWLWLCDNVPVLAKAIQQEVNRGATDTVIRQYVMRKTQRHALALRCEQAAAYLHQAQKEAGAS